MGTSNHLNIQLAGTGRAFNSRVYRYDHSTLVSMDIDLVSQYTLQGDLLSIITANSEIVKSRDCGWIIQRAWSTLFDLAEASAASSVKDMPIRALFLGESMPEKVFMDMLDIFFRMGDVQMTGVLACLVELDRRSRSDIHCTLTENKTDRLPHQPFKLPGLCIHDDSLVRQHTQAP